MGGCHGKLITVVFNSFIAVSLKKQALKQFEKEAKMMLTALPQKASIPKVLFVGNTCPSYVHNMLVGEC